MSAIEDIYAKLRAGGMLDATEAVIYTQHQLKPLVDELSELRRTVASLRGIADDAVADEREACAKVVEGFAPGYAYLLRDDLLTAIRNRI